MTEWERTGDTKWRDKILAGVESLLGGGLSGGGAVAVPQCIGQRMAVRRQNELHAKCGAGVMQQVQRIQVIPHVAIGWVNHGRAAV